MGFILTDKCCEDLDTPQTLGNVMAVRWRAGWTVEEVAKEMNISEKIIERAEKGFEPMPQKVWVDYLSLCGRRMFDDDL